MMRLNRQLVAFLWVFFGLLVGVPHTTPAADASVFRFFFGQDPVETAGPVTGQEVFVIHQDSKTSMEDMAAAAKKVFKETRESNPELANISIAVLLKGSQDDNQDSEELQLATLIQTKEQVRGEHFIIEPGPGFYDHVAGIPKEPTLPLETVRKSPKRLSIVITRTLIAGGFMSLSLMIDKSSLGVVLAGAVAAGLLSGGLAVNNDHFNTTYLAKKPWWDKSGRLSGPNGKKIFRLVRATVSRYRRHALMLTGYLLVVHWAKTLAADPGVIVAAPFAFLGSAALPILWTATKNAISIGQWKQLEASIQEKALLDAQIRHNFDGIGYERQAAKISRKAATAAMVISLVSCAMDALYFAGAVGEVLLPYVQVGVGVSGAGMLVYHNRKFVDWFKKNIMPFKHGLLGALRSPKLKEKTRNRLKRILTGIRTTCVQAFLDLPFTIPYL